ncbi:MAG: site-specific DNA-methyltransferase, partial [Bacteroidales bacterium]|nr:site-specific DNA-methyltransferase [Bacteroidales bacterium]
FDLCTKETYQELIERYHIDKMQGFKTYEEMVAMDSQYQRVFNLPKGKAQLVNVLEFDKDPREAMHPTQKPLALIQRLVLTYSNEGDTILDNCMGSGTTAVACIKEKRHFIGFELNKEYFDKACKRIDAERRQLSLF